MTLPCTTLGITWLQVFATVLLFGVLVALGAVLAALTGILKLQRENAERLRAHAARLETMWTHKTTYRRALDDEVSANPAMERAPGSIGTTKPYSRTGSPGKESPPG